MDDKSKGKKALITYIVYSEHQSAIWPHIEVFFMRLRRKKKSLQKHFAMHSMYLFCKFPSKDN